MERGWGKSVNEVSFSEVLRFFVCTGDEGNWVFFNSKDA